MDQTNYYKILQVDSEAEAEVIKAAYRALSRKYHPDGTHPSAARMVKLNDAYAVLSDAAARARHNDEIERWSANPNRMPDKPTVAPPMRYQETVTEAPKPRRRYRQARVGMLTQIAVISFCAVAALATGLMRPLRPPEPTATLTETAREFLVEPLALQTTFEDEGFVFDTEYTRAGEPVLSGSGVSEAVVVFIADNGSGITYASLQLAPIETLSEADFEAQTSALDHLLDASFGSDPLRENAQRWITNEQANAAEDVSTIISGWLLRVWQTPDMQTGIAVLPASP